MLMRVREEVESFRQSGPLTVVRAYISFSGQDLGALSRPLLLVARHDIQLGN